MTTDKRLESKELALKILGNLAQMKRVTIYDIAEIRQGPDYTCISDPDAVLSKMQYTDMQRKCQSIM